MKNRFSVSNFSLTTCVAFALFTMSAGHMVAQFIPFDANCQLAPGIKLNYNDSEGRRDWMSRTGEGMKLTYPDDLAWGAVFITQGDPKPDSKMGTREVKDMSGYTKMTIEMRSEKEGEFVEIGMKDQKDLNDGSETKIKQKLTSTWQTYPFDLSAFHSCDLKTAHVLVELVFGASKATVFFRNVQFK